MMKFLGLCMFVIGLLSVSPRLNAEEMEMTTPNENVGGVSVVINGTPVSSLGWPATRIFRSKIGGCTSTVVGSRVVLTAAHCVDDGQKARMSVRGRSYKLTCRRHPGYDSKDKIKKMADFALCLSTSKIQRTDYETVNSSAAFPRTGHEIVLLGYGCTETGGFNRDFGTLYIGYATVSRIPSGENLDIVTNDGSAVCYGDSGGAAYVEMPNDRRVVVGVNARGDIKSVSHIASTATPSFLNWAGKWADENGVEICGIHPWAENCR